MYETLILAFICMVTPICARHAGYNVHKKPFDLVGVAGLFFLLAAAFHLIPVRAEWIGLVDLWTTFFSHLLGWLGLIIAAIWAAVDVIAERTWSKRIAAEELRYAHAR